MDRTVVAVVMAGGSGTRLYPASRGDRPKQLLALGPDPVGETGDDTEAGDSTGDDRAGDDDEAKSAGDTSEGTAAGVRSLLVRTLDRAAFADHRVVLTGPDHADRVRDHLADAATDTATDAEVWVEPHPRDTGPALVYAAGRAGAEFDRAVLCHLPSDHHVAGDFGTVAERAVAVAGETGGLVCVGVEPDRPATGYGYVRPGREVDGYAPVAAFHEKPDRDGARELLDEGALWNAGVFAWTPSTLLSAARETPLAPVVEAVDPWNGTRAASAGYRRVDPVSVDHAVMERADHAFVVPAREIEWDDLGTWDALGRVLSADEDGTVVAGDALTVDTHGSVVATGEDTHVTAVGVEDLVVAAYGDRVLVAPRGASDRVREAVERLREEGRF